MSKKILGMGSQTSKYINNFIKIENKKPSDIIEVHNRPIYISLLPNNKSKKILYFHNDPLSMSGSKLTSERLYLAAARNAGLTSRIGRYHNVYGPNQRLDSNYGAVVPIFIDLLSRGIQPTIYGTGQQSRDFVHVHDVARLLVDLATNEWPNPSQSIYNVGTGKAVTVIELASHIHKIAGSGSSLEPTFQSERVGDIERSVASIVAIENDLGWKPEIQLAEGLRKLIEVDTS